MQIERELTTDELVALVLEAPETTDMLTILTLPLRRL